MTGLKVNKERLPRPHKCVIVSFPNGEEWACTAGPATVLIKAVIEVFATKFLLVPAVVRAALPGRTTSLRDNDLCESLGFRTVALKDFPEVTLADASPERFKLIFVSVGAFSEQRKQALLLVTSEAGYDASNIYFVSAFADRSAAPFRKLVSEIAWGTFAWFAGEPDKLLVFREGRSRELSALFTA